MKRIYIGLKIRRFGHWFQHGSLMTPFKLDLIAGTCVPLCLQIFNAISTPCLLPRLRRLFHSFLWLVLSLHHPSLLCAPRHYPFSFSPSSLSFSVDVCAAPIGSPNVSSKRSCILGRCENADKTLSLNSSTSGLLFYIVKPRRFRLSNQN
ncbi:hypothetical protein EDB92DRAFT_277887 [Lactarius akahatsu]|uniref:Uncharacterized protein n=1 Tax=Lactarius akahatsu TaxID=416441 RepID=A0AAD4LIX3_9AGAM|nr:hypothetical protein EDB92DRAFT_277887 [Lactarius akahatsu]